MGQIHRNGWVNYIGISTDDQGVTIILDEEFQDGLAVWNNAIYAYEAIFSEVEAHGREDLVNVVVTIYTNTGDSYPSPGITTDGEDDDDEVNDYIPGRTITYEYDIYFWLEGNNAGEAWHGPIDEEDNLTWDPLMNWIDVSGDAFFTPGSAVEINERTDVLTNSLCNPEVTLENVLNLDINNN